MMMMIMMMMLSSSPRPNTTLLVRDVTKFAQQRAVDLGGVVARRVGSSGEALQQYLHGEAMDRGVYR